MTVRVITTDLGFRLQNGLITKEEVPEYAGLITVGNGVSIVKRAPFITITCFLGLVAKHGFLHCTTQ